MSAYFLLFVSPLTRSEDFSWAHFRDYFPFDQYSYLAIASNVQAGDYRAVEPFTQTGANHYPRLYYIFLGTLSRILGADLVLTWQVTGVILQLLMVGAVSILCIRLTGLRWAGVIGFLPFTFGTFAWLESSGWYRALESHGVLWPAFGVLFTVNGESAALCIAVIAISAVIFAVQGSPSNRTRKILIVGSFGLVGLLANIQTYSFLASVYLLAFAFASYGLIVSRSRGGVLLSVMVTAAVLLLGPGIAGTAGPLVTLAAGAAGSIPGLLQVLKRHRSTFLLSAVALLALAMPTVLGTVLGRMSGDPFLTYREASSSNLGVPFSTGLAAAVIPLVVLALILAAGVISRNPFWISYASGSVIAWGIVSTNDLWGANQEPYRFWIDCFTIISATSVPVFAGVVVQSWRLREASEGWRRGEGGIRMPTRLALVAISSTCVVVALVISSLPDYFRFSEYVRAQGTVDMRTGQMEAASTVIQRSDPSESPAIKDQGVSPLMFDPCIDPLRLKYAAGAPIAFYNLGLAWPADEPGIRGLLRDRVDGRFDSAKALSAGVQFVVTDSSCVVDWTSSIRGSVVQRSAYESAEGSSEVRLWELDR